MSLLGDVVWETATDEDPDTLTTAGVTYFAKINTSTKYPFTGYGVIKITKGIGNRLVQTIQKIGGVGNYTRTRDNANAWTAWIRNDNNGDKAFDEYVIPKNNGSITISDYNCLFMVSCKDDGGFVGLGLFGKGKAEITWLFENNASSRITFTRTQWTSTTTITNIANDLDLVMYAFSWS